MRAMPRYVTTVMLVLGSFLTGCGPMYWQAPGRGVIEFRADSNLCIQEAKSKYEVSERIYRRCMREHGWERVQTNYPTNSQFRGPEDEDDFFSPPPPLSKRGPAPDPGGNPDCRYARRPVERPAHCPR
jgi:hypothetical protein